ncbi:hypothetical protein J2S17_000111 [Cytobacillus purgationiresistens]|uniref:Uncharacterized protein n=1 Tax=Cytobacillus purgationiresistens TaxID=863449 RepID=A0ABU0AAG4_9BACI|nr:hypothetical protein [Cytobacillus purgationiresistens]
MKISLETEPFQSETSKEVQISGEYDAYLTKGN